MCYSWSEVTAALAGLRLHQHSPASRMKRLNDGYAECISGHDDKENIPPVCPDSMSSLSQHLDTSHNEHTEANEQWFLQRIIKGTDKTILFSALDGVLTGCVMMTKVLSTAQGKVWAGDIVSVPCGLVKQLMHFVQHTAWTGGGEIEFIETIEDQFMHHAEEKKKYFIIDFNPRFPAWVLGSVFTGCNLPADFIAQAIEAEAGREAGGKVGRDGGA